MPDIVFVLQHAFYKDGLKSIPFISFYSICVYIKTTVGTKRIYTVCFFFICGRSKKGVVCITWLICLAHLFTYLIRVQNSFRNIFYSKGWRKMNKKEDFSCGRSFFKTYFKFCLISMLVPSDLMYGQKAVFNHFDQKMAKFGQNLVKIWSFLKFQN